MTQTILTIIFAGLAVVTSESPNDSDQALILTMVLYPILALPVLSLLSIGTSYTYLFATYQHCDYQHGKAA